VLTDKLTNKQTPMGNNLTFGEATVQSRCQTLHSRDVHGNENPMGIPT